MRRTFDNNTLFIIDWFSVCNTTFRNVVSEFVLLCLQKHVHLLRHLPDGWDARVPNTLSKCNHSDRILASNFLINELFQDSDFLHDARKCTQVTRQLNLKLLDSIVCGAEVDKSDIRLWCQLPEAIMNRLNVDFQAFTRFPIICYGGDLELLREQMFPEKRLLIHYGSILHTID